jgi:hypothetical protein
MIGFAGEQRAGFLFADVGFGRVQFLCEVFQEIVALLGVGFFLGQVDVGVDVTRNAGEFFVGGNLVFGAFAIAEDGLGFFLVVPEIGVGGASFERFQAVAVLRGVKDSSEPWRCGV